MSETPREHPYASFLHLVQKPSRYVGGEHGEVRKAADQIDARFCLAFPDVYDIGMSHLGFKILYGILNAHPRLAAERCYTPWTDMEHELRARNEPLRSLETAIPLREFDAVGFSLQFELTYTNVLTMLDLGGIPLRSADRGEDDPLIIVGGPVATHAEPLAPFFDVALIGDGEQKTPELLLAWSSLKKAGVPRAERLRAIAKLGGLYVPSLYETELCAETKMRVVARPTDPSLPFPVERAFVPNLDAYPFPSGGPVSSTETIFDRVSVEIARGCTEGCRFCQAGMIYRPVRERSPESIVETISNAVKDGGYDEASLTSLSTADYSAINPLVKAVMKEFEKERIALSVSSLRAYGLDEELLDEIRKVRATGLTFAPEAGSQRMRDVVNKNITEEQLMTTAERVFSRGWSKMKLYFMLGLPTEEEEDVRAIVQTGVRAWEVGKKAQKGRGPDVTVSVSIHVPKPHTPFQWCAMDGKETVLTKQSWLKDEVRGAPSNVKLRMHPSDGSWLEGVLARGDRRLGDVIERAWKNGARFDSWEEHLRWDVWSEAIAACDVDPTVFLGTIPVTARLPWDHISVGLEEGFLAREYKKALASRLSPPCGKVAGAFVHATNLKDAEAQTKKLVCYDCGVACDMSAMREERLVFLRTLKSIEPPPPRPERVPGEKVHPLHRQRPPLLDQGGKQRVRLHYQKLGRAAYRGHLDLVRVLPRVFRRIGLPLRYSQGFHPKPEMVFGPALSLGIASLAEYVDLTIDTGRDFTLVDCVDRLNAVTEDGLVFVEATELGGNDPGINKVIAEAEYVVGIPRTALKDLGLASTEELRSRIEARRGGPLEVLRELEGGLSKRIDVGLWLEEVDVDRGHEHLHAAGIVGDLVPVRLLIRVAADGSGKPSETIDALVGARERGLTETPCRIVRVALRNEKHATPMQLELCRKPRSADVVAADVVAADSVEA